MALASLSVTGGRVGLKEPAGSPNRNLEPSRAREREGGGTKCELLLTMKTPEALAVIVERRRILATNRMDIALITSVSLVRGGVVVLGHVRSSATVCSGRKREEKEEKE